MRVEALLGIRYLIVWIGLEVCWFLAFAKLEEFSAGFLVILIDCFLGLLVLFLAAGPSVLVVGFSYLNSFDIT